MSICKQANQIFFLFGYHQMVRVLVQKSGDAASGCGLHPCFNLKLVRDPILERSLSGIRMKRFNSALKHRLKVEGLQGGEHQLPFKPVKGFLNETEWKWLQLR